MKGLVLWGILLIAMLAILIFAGEAMYGIAQIVAGTIGQIVASLQATIGSLI